MINNRFVEEFVSDLLDNMSKINEEYSEALYKLLKPKIPSPQYDMYKYKGLVVLLVLSYKVNSFSKSSCVTFIVESLFIRVRITSQLPLISYSIPILSILYVVLSFIASQFYVRTTNSSAFIYASVLVTPTLIGAVVGGTIGGGRVPGFTTDEVSVVLWGTFSLLIVVVDNLLSYSRLSSAAFWIATSPNVSN